MNEPLVEVRDLVKHFPLSGGWLTGDKKIVHALDGINLDIIEGEVLGLVGESGCGKTTLGRCILSLLKPTAGTIRFMDNKLSELSKHELRRQRVNMQIVFQNPLSSFNPRMTVEQSMQEPLTTHHIPKKEWDDRISEMLAYVGLGKHQRDRYPHELSGGQLQRVSIARALILRPRLLVLDEPTSALDVSVQAQIINLLQDLRRELGLTLIFISHDLAVVEHLSDRIGVMYLGKLVELGSAETIMNHSQHPYTQALIRSVPKIYGTSNVIEPLEGSLPSATHPPSGCRFHTRCPFVIDICRHQEPPLVHKADQLVACHIVE